MGAFWFSRGEFVFKWGGRWLPGGGDLAKCGHRLPDGIDLAKSGGKLAGANCK